MEGATKALILNRVTNTAAVTTPVNGMIVYDLSSNCFKGYQDGSWSGCGFVPTSTGGTAVVSSYGAPSCTANAISGTMTQGTAVSGVTMSLYANVTTLGTYNITAGPTNGVTFIGTGTFTALGCQLVTLTAAGTPTAAGTNTFTTNTTPAGTVTASAGGTIPGNATCVGKTISTTSCASVAGVTLNNDAATALGTEYDWSSATSTTMGTGFGASTNTRALVEIGGQCWAKFNMNINNNLAAAVNDGVDRGSTGYYTGGPFANEGILYQWSSAMNSATTERAQGVCPTAWHIPSDCEFMYLENTLGMTVADQETNTAWRYTGTVGSDLSTLTSGGTNTSGFTGLLTGYGSYAPSFNTRGVDAYWWSSSAASATTAFDRELNTSFTGVYRNTNNKAYSFSVRCLKD